MTSWAAQKRAQYIGTLIVVVGIVGGGVLFFVVRDKPTCTDGIQNGTEEGVDCGGECQAICPFAATAPVIQWTRFFEQAPGVYSVVALIENPNSKASAMAVPYEFSLRDENNVLIYERKGQVNLLARQRIPIFESGLVTGNRIPRRAAFSFTKSPEWVTDTPQDIPLRISQENLVTGDTEQRLSARVRNTELAALSDVRIVALLFSADGNAVAASQTVIDFLPGSGEKDIVFSWQAPFAETIVKIDLVPVLR